jgi:hypothetical protein
MVHLQKFHEKYGNQGLQVFAISMHPDSGEARKLTAELGVTFPVFNGHDSELGKLFAYG